MRIKVLLKIGGKDTSQQQQWIQIVRDDLWQGRLDDVIGACQQHIQPQLQSEKDHARLAVTYFKNNRQRMDYPTYRLCIHFG